MSQYAKPETIRNTGDLRELVSLLQSQRTRALDVVAPTSALTAFHGNLLVEGTEVAIDETGVTQTAGQYGITKVAEEGIAGKLNIPQQYLRRMRETHPDLYDANVNGWLRHASQADAKYLVRVLRTLDGDNSADGNGLVRAFLSNGYRIIDNLDVLLATLDGINAAGIEAQIRSADLTDRRMYVRILAPQVMQMAPELLAGYRSPFEQGATRTGSAGLGHTAEGQPIVFAGFEIRNSDVGNGAFEIKPQIVVQVCTNGMTIDAAKVRRVHMGARLDEGEIKWSDETQQRNLDLIKSQTADAVTQFLSPEFLAAQVTKLEQAAAAKVAEPAKTIEVVTKQLTIPEHLTESILSHFILGGQLTAGGVAQAVSSVAQTVESGDLAAELEAAAIPAMYAAAAVK